MYIVKVVGKEKLSDFARCHADSKKAIAALTVELENADWCDPYDIKKQYPKASIIGNKNVVLNLCGNNYRVWMKAAYKNKAIMIKKVGTHKEYDNWEIK